MRTAVVLVGALILILTGSCVEKKVKKQSISKAIPVDSFYFVIQQRREVLHSFFTPKNNSIVSGFYNKAKVNFYQKNNKLYTLHHAVNYGNTKATLFQYEGGKLCFLGEDSLQIVDVLTKESEKFMLDLKLNHLGNDYLFSSLKYHPAFIKKNKLYALFYYRSLKDYEAYLKEKCLAIFQLDSNKATFLKTIFNKPNCLKNYRQPYAKYCVANNKIVLLFPPLDTLYFYDLNTSKLTKRKINNRLYQLPQKYNYKKRNDSGYDTKYYSNNFAYHSVFFNKKTKHYFLFFEAPNFKKTKILIYPNITYVLILDDAFNTIKIQQLGNQYFSKESGMMTNKGFALPIYNINANEKKLKYHIFNF